MNFLLVCVNSRRLPIRWATWLILLLRTCLALVLIAALWVMLSDVCTDVNGSPSLRSVLVMNRCRSTTDRLSWLNTRPTTIVSRLTLLPVGGIGM